jgi:hypothetical protein
MADHEKPGATASGTMVLESLEALRGTVGTVSPGAREAEVRAATRIEHALAALRATTGQA